MLGLFKKKTKTPPQPMQTIQQQDPEVVHTNQTRVSCDGPEHGRHPRIYLNMGDDDHVVCPYCSRTFVLKT